jgi:hypothetical protein
LPFVFVKGSLTRDFRLQVFFMNQCPPGPQVFHWSLFEFFHKFAEIFANNCLSPVSTTPVISCSAVSTTSAKNLSPVLLTPVNNLYFHGVVDTVQKKPKSLKFIAGVNDTADCSPVSMTLLIKFSAVSATPVIRESCQY